MRRIFLAFALTAVASSARAQPPPVIDPTTESGVPGTEPDAPSASDAEPGSDVPTAAGGTLTGPSAQLKNPRAGKRITLGLEPIGFPALLPAFGGTVGFLVTPDAAIELNHVRNSYDVYIFELYTRITTLRLKKYWGKSFYTNFGVGQRTVGASFSLDDFAVDELNAETEITSLVGDFAIGNQWTFERWAAGVDWIGWMPHFKVIESHDDYPYEQASPDEKEERSRFEKLAARGTPQFLRLYVGVVL